jgi:hypothetical protein
MIRLALFLPLFAGSLIGFNIQKPEVGGRDHSKLRRLPVQKKDITLTAPKTYERRVLSYDERTREPISYDPRPRVVLLDARSGKYGLKWLGYDGKEKTVIYQRPDRIDAIVRASVTRTPSGGFLYSYGLDNLPSSGQQLSSFGLQTFSSDVRPIKKPSGYVGAMSKNRSMSEGNWILYGSSYFDPTIGPGKSAEARLESSAPPGLVECSVTGGRFGMKGAGEHMPQELENVLPGYEIWPRGLTLGPHDWLKSATTADKVSYIKKIIPRMRELGWLTASKSRWYEQNLGGQNLSLILQRVEDDFRSGEITSEVRDLIRLNLQ